MRGLLMTIVILAVFWATDRIACEGRYSRAFWRQSAEQSDYVR